VPIYIYYIINWLCIFSGDIFRHYCQWGNNFVLKEDFIPESDLMSLF